MSCHRQKTILEIVGVAGYPIECFVPPKVWGFTEKGRLPEYDPAICQQFLAEAGYPKGKGLPELDFIVSEGLYPKTKEYCPAIATMLEEQGFPIRLKVMAVAPWLEVLWTRPGGAPGHMVDSGWSTGTPEPDATLRPLYKGGNSMICELNDPEIDAALSRERGEADLEKRKNVLERETFPII
ncbi:MAG: hypothetical protein GY850_44140 [bacterium]|nr:hypothetical protein [bacterium]